MQLATVMVGTQPWAEPSVRAIRSSKRPWLALCRVTAQNSGVVTAQMTRHHGHRVQRDFPSFLDLDLLGGQRRRAAAHSWRSHPLIAPTTQTGCRLGRTLSRMRYVSANPSRPGGWPTQHHIFASGNGQIGVASQ